MPDKSTLERALELARDSHCKTVDDLRRKLSSEGYANVEQHLAGASIKKQLKELIQNRLLASPMLNVE